MFIKYFFLIITLFYTYSGVSPMESGTISNYPVPPSLMIHGEGLSFLVPFIDELELRGYKTITYIDYFQSLLDGENLGKVFILSIDDIGPYGINIAHKEMIEFLLSRGHVAVLGVTGGDFTSKKEWDFLLNLENNGWEIANHTLSHVPEGLPSLTYDEILTEIETLNEKITLNTGIMPMSLILPGGTYLYDTRIDKAVEFLGMKYIIGIGEGTQITLENSVYYVGRGYIVNFIPIQTFDIIELIFEVPPETNKYSNKAK